MNVAYNFFKKFHAILKKGIPLLLIAACVIMVIIIALNQTDPTKQQMADLKEEFRGYGVRYFVDAQVSPTIYENVDSKDDFIHLIVKYEPKILYIRTSIKSFTFTFFEDEGEKLIAYRWYCDFELWR